MPEANIIPQLPPKCGVCHHEKRFEIQKAIDDGMGYEEIEQKYGLPKHVIQNHNKVGHRKDLITWGYIDMKMRKEAINTGGILCRFIRKWAKKMDSMAPEDIKNTDALKAMEIYARVQGEMIDKHEVIIKKDLGTVIKEYLSDGDETKTS